MLTARQAWGASALGALLALPAGDVAWAISTHGAEYAWPELTRAQFWLWAAALGLAWGWLQAVGWRLAFHFDLKTGLRIGAASLLPCLLGLFWPAIARFPLPPPHDFPGRNLQILLAAQLIATLWAAWGLALLFFWKSGRLAPWSARTAALRLGGAALVFFQLNGFWVGQWNMTGDAPHYLLMSHSLAFDGDLDLANNYRHKDWRTFYDYSWDLPPQGPAQADGQVLTEHKPGLSILMAPAYRLAGDSGARWTLAILAATASGLFYALCLALGFEADLALLGWALFSFTAPWMSQSQCVFAEMLGGLILMASLSALGGAIPASTGWAAIAFGYWVHIRYAVLGAALSLVTAFKRGPKGLRQAVIPLLLTGASLGLSFMANRLLFGAANPMQIRQMSLNELFNPAGIIRYACGILMDQEYGFLPFAAVFALAPLGLAALWKRDRRWFWQTVLPGASYFALVASFPYWWSAMAPNRFMTALMPVVALWTLEAWRAWGGRPLFWALAAYSWGWGLLMSVLPWLNFSKGQGENWILRIVGARLHHSLTPYFPSFILNTPVSYAWVLGLALGLTVLWKRLGPPR